MECFYRGTLLVRGTLSHSRPRSKQKMPKVDEGLRFIYPEDLPAIEQAFAKVMHEGGKFEVDCRVVRPDGTIRHVHSRADPVFNGSGKLVEYAGTIIDNTERTQAEEALQRAKDELAHMARLTTMGELAASIAHEVNQPLSSVVYDRCRRVSGLARQDTSEYPGGNCRREPDPGASDSSERGALQNPFSAEKEPAGDDRCQCE